MDNLSIEVLGLIAGAVTTIGFIPQLIRGYRTKKLDDVSYFMPGILAIGMSLWFIYGYLLTAFAVMIANACGVTFSLTLIILKIRYKKNSSL